jgi:hypothetical protein
MGNYSCLLRFDVAVHTVKLPRWQSCWGGFLHAPLGSLHILELGGIATRGL